MSEKAQLFHQSYPITDVPTGGEGGAITGGGGGTKSGLYVGVGL